MRRIYEGDFKNGLKHGKGILHLDDYGYYEGNFENDMYHGKGVLQTKHLRYEGLFKFGQFEGLGIKYENMQAYEGEWEAGKKNGNINFYTLKLESASVWHNDSKVESSEVMMNDVNNQINLNNANISRTPIEFNQNFKKNISNNNNASQNLDSYHNNNSNNNNATSNNLAAACKITVEQKTSNFKTITEQAVINTISDSSSVRRGKKRRNRNNNNTNNLSTTSSGIFPLDKNVDRKDLDDIMQFKNYAKMEMNSRLSSKSSDLGDDLRSGDNASFAKYKFTQNSGEFSGQVNKDTLGANVNTDASGEVDPNKKNCLIF